MRKRAYSLHSHHFHDEVVHRRFVVQPHAEEGHWVLLSLNSVSQGLQRRGEQARFQYTAEASSRAMNVPTRRPKATQRAPIATTRHRKLQKGPQLKVAKHHRNEGSSKFPESVLAGQRAVSPRVTRRYSNVLLAKAILSYKRTISTSTRRGIPPVRLYPQCVCGLLCRLIFLALFRTCTAASSR